MKKGFLLTALLAVSGSAAVNAQKADTPMSQVVELGLNRAKSQSLILADALKDQPNALPRSFEPSKGAYATNHSLRSLGIGLFPRSAVDAV